MSKETLGRFGEEVASLYLKEAGYKIIERNFRTKRWGELDIVAEKSGTLVFVEVKTRTTKRYGEPYESINFYKKRALLRAAQFYKLARTKSPEKLRLDLISVFVDPDTKKVLALDHIPSILEAPS